MINDPELNEWINSELPSLVELRHDLHAHPQVAFEETYAADVIQNELRRLDIPFEAGVGETGVVAWIIPDDKSAAAKDAIALRADMDALAIHEENEFAYKSANEGFMHACGHDGHVTMLIGAARILSKQRDKLPQPVKLFFQPAEETAPGVIVRGADRLVEAGALDDRIGGVSVGSVFAMHGWPKRELGHIATAPGPFFASSESFTITIQGRGGHGAAPHLTADPIIAAAQMITALQSIVSRNAPPALPVVLTVATVHAGTASNIIPQDATLSGTIRTLDEATRAMIHQRIKTIVTQTAAAMDCRAEVDILPGCPVTINDPAATDYVLNVARRVVGESRVSLVTQSIMTAEDFAVYGRSVPSCLLLLGTCPSGCDDYPLLHTPQYDFNDAAIPVGVAMLCRLAMDA
ncbi:MAG: amidohydrolase [Phycisphaerae bacterium]|nr:amidohydrolase [Phycisphaerae bacterium]